MAVLEAQDAGPVDEEVEAPPSSSAAATATGPERRVARRRPTSVATRVRGGRPPSPWWPRPSSDRSTATTWRPRRRAGGPSPGRCLIRRRSPAPRVPRTVPSPPRLERVLVLATRAPAAWAARPPRSARSWTGWPWPAACRRPPRGARRRGRTRGDGVDADVEQHPLRRHELGHPQRVVEAVPAGLGPQGLADAEGHVVTEDGQGRRRTSRGPRAYGPTARTDRRPTAGPGARHRVAGDGEADVDAVHDRLGARDPRHALRALVGRRDVRHLGPLAARPRCRAGRGPRSR